MWYFWDYMWRGYILMLLNYIIGNKYGCCLIVEINIYVFFNEVKLMVLFVIGMFILGII